MSNTDTTPPLSIMAIDHVVLRCANIARTLAFYRDVLGCALERELPGIGLHQLRAGASLIDLVPVGSALAGDGEPHPGHENMHHVCFRIAPVHWPDLLAHLSRHGAHADEPARRYGAQGYGRSVYLRDPEGNTVELTASGS